MSTPAPRWDQLIERMVIDGPLEADEQQQLDVLRHDDPAFEAELATLEAMAAFVDDAPAVSEDVLRRAERRSATVSAVEASAPAEASDSEVVSSGRARRRRAVVASIVGVAAVAAAVALVLAVPEDDAARDRPRIATTAGEVQIHAKSDDPRLRPGDEIEVGDGHACLSFASGIWACTTSETQVTFESDHPESLELTVHRGQLTARLDPLPSGHHFSIRAAHVRATAVGTIFSVEYAPDEDRIEARVVQGAIDVDVGGSTLRLDAHHGAVITGEHVALEPLAHETETTDLGVLRSRGQSGERPQAIARSLEEDADSAPDAAIRPTADPSAPGSGRRGRSSAPRTGSGDSGPRAPSPAGDDDELIIDDEPPASTARNNAPLAGLDAAQMLREARQALDSGRSGRAARAYRALIEKFPRSPEAQAARVAVADLYLHAMNKPAVAERYFAAYLERGGPLALQARHGRILALRRSTRTKQEAAAIEQFLRHHPKSGHAGSLRARLEQIGPR